MPQSGNWLGKMGLSKKKWDTALWSTLFFQIKLQFWWAFPIFRQAPFFSKPLVAASPYSSDKFPRQEVCNFTFSNSIILQLSCLQDSKSGNIVTKNFIFGHPSLRLTNPCKDPLPKGQMATHLKSGSLGCGRVVHFQCDTTQASTYQIKPRT